MWVRTDWPFGPALKKARISAGLSVRAAARRTNSAISAGRWYQLESGIQKARGQEIPIGTTPATVAAAAKAVDWDVNEALTVAGFDPRDYQPPPKMLSPLRAASNEDLLAEILRRFEEEPSAAGRSPVTADEREHPVPEPFFVRGTGEVPREDRREHGR